MPVRKFICPQCGERSGVEIIYGEPGVELAEQAERGEICLGGCCLTEGQPDRHCTACEHEWRIRRRRSQWQIELAKAGILVDLRKPKFVASPLSRSFTSNDMTVDVKIYRRAAPSVWTFQVLTHEGITIQSIEDFETDEEALQAFEAEVAQHGIESYLDDAPSNFPICRGL